MGEPVREGALGQRLLSDGRELVVYPLTFGRARLVVGEQGAPVYDDGWCYDTPKAAVAAMEVWNGHGEPEGWMRHPTSGRRRPDGDATREYVMP